MEPTRSCDSTFVLYSTSCYGNERRLRKKWENKNLTTKALWILVELSLPLIFLLTKSGGPLLSWPPPPTSKSAGSDPLTPAGIYAPMSWKLGALYSYRTSSWEGHVRRAPLTPALAAVLWYSFKTKYTFFIYNVQRSTKHEKLILYDSLTVNIRAVFVRSKVSIAVTILYANLY